MIPAIMLCSMAVLDAALAGIRAVAGRDAHVDKGARLRQWSLRGAAAGVGELVVIATMLLGLLARSDDRALLFADMVSAGTRMLAVFMPYTVVVLGALAAYAVPHLEVRCLATVVVLGPLTMARSAVLLLGALAAAWGAPAVVQVAAFVTVAVVLAGEVVLHRWADSLVVTRVAAAP